MSGSPGKPPGGSGEPSMSKRPHPVLFLLATALALSSVAPSAGASNQAVDRYTRIYLLGTDSDFLYWSVDPSDPEIDAGRLERQCSSTKLQGTPGYKPCNFQFLQGTQLLEPAAW